MVNQHFPAGMTTTEFKTLVEMFDDYISDSFKEDCSYIIGKGFDTHKAIGKLPKPKAGFTPGKTKYMGLYNPLEKQLEYDKRW